jgi:two-component system, NtrC family, sensor kinase
MKIALRSKIHIGLISLLLLFGGGIYLIASRILSEALLEDYRSRGQLVAGNLAAWAVEPVLAMDFARLKTLVDDAVHSNKDVHYAFILNDRGKVLVHTFAGGFPTELKAVHTVGDSETHSRRLLNIGGELIYDFAVPVVIGGDRFGTVRLGLLRTRLTEAINRLSSMMLLATALFVVFAGVVAGALARTVGKRIELLHRSIEKVMRGDLDVVTAPPPKRNCWEIIRCGRTECPAYRQTNLRCWYVAGTLCPSCIEGEYAKKITSCLTCPVYRTCSGDEIQILAESFDFMARTLKDHLLELQAAGTSLSEQQNLLSTILNATPDFVSLQDRDSVYRAVNRAFCEVVGRSENEIVGRTDFDLFSRARALSNRKEDLSLLESGEPLMKENRVGETNGQRWIHLVKLPVRDSTGAIIGMLCSGRDITDVKRFQEQLTQAQKMEAVGQLTAGIAHEINTPLGIILGYAQLLAEDIDPGSQMHADLKTIEKHAKICRKIVSDLLRFSRHTESRMAPLNINKVIEEALSVVEHTFSLERVRVERKLGAGLPPVVGDEEKLKQAVVNLLNNAFDAIGTNGLITISTAFAAEPGEVLIFIADTGKGIPKEHLGRIFDPFFTTKGVGKGTGLGLSVTFGIVKDHGGKIEARSPLPSASAREMNKTGGEQGALKGTVFAIHLPAQRHESGTRREETNGSHSGVG